jgi:hypothetical protein
MTAVVYLEAQEKLIVKKPEEKNLLSVTLLCGSKPLFPLANKKDSAWNFPPA